MGCVAGDRVGATVRIGIGRPVGALADRARRDVMGAGAAGRGADQGAGTGRLVSLRTLRIRWPTRRHRLWRTSRLRLLDDRESTVLSALRRRGSAGLGARRLVRPKPRLLYEPGRPGARRGAL